MTNVLIQLRAVLARCWRWRFAAAAEVTFSDTKSATDKLGLLRALCRAVHGKASLAQQQAPVWVRE